jgi:hypothetical protein
LSDVLEDALSPQATNNRGFFQAEKVVQVKRAFIAGEVHWSQPWLLSIIELWCRTLLDGESTA